MVTWAIVIAIFGISWNRVAASSSVDNAAHLGGFLGGAALGWLAARVRARGGAEDRAWAMAARLTVVAALLVAAVFWAPFALRIFERHDMELYWRLADRTLRGVEEALAGGNPADLPAAFDDGPGGSEGVRDAIREALTLARSREPGAAAALSRAQAALAQWSSSLFCSHALRPTLGTG
jgi:hypothetical protein